MTTEALKEAMGVAPAGRPETFPQMLVAWKREIAVALPKHLNADTMARVALTCFRMTPKLAECVPSTVFACVIMASQLGLRPGLMGECYLIPYHNKKAKKTICTLQIGYQGMIELGRRSGQILDIAAYVVHEKDRYEVRFGSTPGIVHEPYLEGDPGKVILAYAVAELRGGAKHFEVMTLHDIHTNHRNRSANYRQAKAHGFETPWDTDEEEMCRKTMVRRIHKYLPKSNELALGLALDDAANLGTQALTVQDAIDNVWVPEVIDVESKETSGSTEAAGSAKDQGTGKAPLQTPGAEVRVQVGPVVGGGGGRGTVESDGLPPV